ncbi:MAG: response regulator [Chloroflexota bacterium]
MRSLRVVIAEDEPLVTQTLTEQLRHLGHRVIGEAANGEEVVNMVLDARPDLVIMDIKMPKLSGLQASRAIMEKAPVPIILLTAYTDDAFIEEAASVGAMAYLVKPVDERDLVPAIRLVVSQFEQLQSLRREVDDLREALETRKLVERAKGVLMEVHGLREAEAFHRIRKASMDARKSMREVAEAILLTHEMEIGPSDIAKAIIEADEIM